MKDALPDVKFPVSGDSRTTLSPPHQRATLIADTPLTVLTWMGNPGISVNAGYPNGRNLDSSGKQSPERCEVATGWTMAVLILKNEPVFRHSDGVIEEELICGYYLSSTKLRVTQYLGM